MPWKIKSPIVMIDWLMRPSCGGIRGKTFQNAINSRQVVAVDRRVLLNHTAITRCLFVCQPWGSFLQVKITIFSRKNLYTSLELKCVCRRTKFPFSDTVTAKPKFQSRIAPSWQKLAPRLLGRQRASYSCKFDPRRGYVFGNIGNSWKRGVLPEAVPGTGGL